eukprot:15367180-Ditylum_brightwellii.AAC.3
MTYNINQEVISLLLIQQNNSRPAKVTLLEIITGLSFATTNVIAPDQVGGCILLGKELFMQCLVAKLLKIHIINLLWRGQNTHNNECLLHSLVPILLWIDGGFNVKLPQFTMHPLHNAE